MECGEVFFTEAEQQSLSGIVKKKCSQRTSASTESEAYGQYVYYNAFYA